MLFEKNKKTNDNIGNEFFCQNVIFFFNFLFLSFFRFFTWLDPDQ